MTANDRDHTSKAKFAMFRQAVADFILSFPIAVVSFMAGDTRIATIYTACHLVAVVTYALTGMWGLDKQPGSNVGQMILRTSATFMAHCASWTDFLFAYVLGCRVTYCGDATIPSPNFYRTFVFSNADNYCDAYHSGGAIYTLVAAFVLVYCSIGSAVFGLSMLSTDGAGGDVSKSSKIGTMVYAIAVIRAFQVIWFHREWKDLSYAYPRPWKDSFFLFIMIVTGGTTFILGIVYLIVFYSASLYYSREPIMGYLLMASEVITVVVSVSICFVEVFPTLMETILPILIFFPSALYICVVWYTERNGIGVAIGQPLSQASLGSKLVDSGFDDLPTTKSDSFAITTSKLNHRNNTRVRL